VKVKPLVFKRKRMMRILIPDGLRFVGLKTDLQLVVWLFGWLVVICSV